MDSGWQPELAKQYRTVKLPSKMLEEIELLIRDYPEWGYSSIADFIKDAVRFYFWCRIDGTKCKRKTVVRLGSR
jgi:metal-responsive CopG/Arc/MetJ family transcriptional regulator